MKIIRIASTTALVFDLLKRDLLTEQQLRLRLPQCGSNQISAALVYLQKRKAIGFLADEVTTLYYATPETDDRSTVHEEYAPHTKPRRARRSMFPKQVK
jgi:hypothetical protein